MGVGAYVTYATFNLNLSQRRPQRKLWQKFNRMHIICGNGRVK